MARLEAEVTANIGPFEHALNKATEEAREFAAKTKDVGKDVFKETAGGGAFKMAGLAGAATAATAFGVAVVDAAKESLGAFGHMETQILRLKYNLKDPTVAKEVHEWLEGIAGGDEEVDKLHAAFVSLSEAGLDMEKSKEVLQDLQAVAFKSGESVDGLAEAFRRAKAGGLDAGEGAAKLLKSLPGLSEEIEKQKVITAKSLEYGVTNEYGQYLGSDPAKLAKMAEAKQVRQMSPADYVKAGLMNTKELEEMLHRMAPRGMMAERRGTLEGAEGRLTVVLDNLRESFGEGLAPAIKQLANDLSANLPSIETNLKDFGTAIGNALGFIKSLTTPGEGLKKWGQAEEDFENKIFKGLGDLLTGNAADLFKGQGTQPTTEKLGDHLEKSVGHQETMSEYLKRIDDALRQVFSTQ